MGWRIEFAPKAQKVFEHYPEQVQKQILSYLHTRIQPIENPRDQGIALKGEMKGYWRYRVGDYRVICRIDDEKIVILVVKTGHRKEVYD